MGTAIPLRYVIGKTVNIFVITVIPLQRNFHTNAVFFGHKIKRFGMNWGFIMIEILDKRLNTAFIMEVIMRTITFIE